MEINRSVVWVGIVIACLLVPLLVFRAGFVTFVDNYEYAFTFNRFTGQVEVLNRTGYFIRAPWHYSVHAIDTRPIQLQITANSGGSTNSVSNDINQRVLNAKLVRFNPNGLDTFIQWHGRSAGDKRDSLSEILRCYAFDRAEGRDCPFIEILSELSPGQSDEKNTDYQ